MDYFNLALGLSMPVGIFFGLVIAKTFLLEYSVSRIQGRPFRKELLFPWLALLLAAKWMF